MEKPVQTTFLSFFVTAVATTALIGTAAWHGKVPRGGSRGKTRAGTSTLLPFCNLESIKDANALENAIWVDPLDEDSRPASWQTLVPHPTSQDMTKNLQQRILLDPNDADRLRRIARLELDTQQSHCRIKAWDRNDFEKCLQGRRLIFVGDSMSMQQTESLSYLLDLTSNWTKIDEPARKRGVCRHCIDATTENGLHIIGRAIYHSDEEDLTPLRFNREAFEIMVTDIGGWKEGDILVVNFGAHYMASLMELRDDLNLLFHGVLAKIPQQVTIFWRDYAPAHFQTFPDGEYSPFHYIKSQNEPACVPHLMAPKTPSIVKHAVNRIIRECGEPCGRIRRINAWDLLRNAWDQHTDGSTCFQDDWWCDCRHYAIPGPMDFTNVLLYNQLCAVSSEN